jgi:quercetin dioxygenase-like cupin family protein
MNTKTNLPFNVLGVVLQWQLRSQDTDGQYGALLATVLPQGMVPPHQHREQEAFFLLEGNAEFASMREGTLQWKPVSAGEMINIPSDESSFHEQFFSRWLPPVF